MANQRQIKRRISASKNISQITKAMEMVSASKMKKAQAQALAARPYARALHESLQKVTQQVHSKIHPLLTKHSQGKPALLLVSTDKGLVGGLNHHLFKEALHWLEIHPDGLIIPIGKKALRFCQLAGAAIHAQFTELPEHLSTDDIAPITTLLSTEFLQKTFFTVDILYMDFINTLSQKPRLTQLLPLGNLPKENHENSNGSSLSNVSQPATKSIQTDQKQNHEANLQNHEYIFEPSAQSILGDLLPYYLENTLYQSFLEARASEHSSRMVAMKNASENATELVHELQLEFNKTRQASITSELIDLTTASLSVS